MSPGVLELAIIVGVAATLAMIMRMFRQPVILAYLLTGLLLGALGLRDVVDQNIFSLFSQLGIVFLLFLVGLEINYTSLRTVGLTAIVVGVVEIIVSFLLGWGLAFLLGFSTLVGAYIALAFSFSSTIIVIKLLAEKKDLNSLYGKISIGFMLVQDLVAILILIALGGIEHGGSFGLASIIVTLIKGIALFGFMMWIGRKLIPHAFDRVARSGELLFLMTLAWVFLVIAVVSKLGFSLEIGGFLAGLALANSAEHYQVASKMRPLRDFFILIFFVVLGVSLTHFNLDGLAWPMIVFSLFVLIGNPLIVLVVMGAMGYRRRTSFLAGVTVAQISEFSLILVALGLRLGHIDDSIVALVTWVGVITILLSTYTILRADDIYKKIHHVLRLFERKKASEPTLAPNMTKKDYVLIGASRIGAIILQHFPHSETLVIDFDPSIVERLQKRGVNAVLGDIADRELLEDLGIQQAKMVVSTSPDLQDTLALIEYIKGFSRLPGRQAGRPRLIVRAEHSRDAALLYKKGVDYVIVPSLTSGHYIGEILADTRERSKSLWHARERDFKLMKSSDLKT